MLTFLQQDFLSAVVRDLANDSTFHSEACQQLLHPRDLHSLKYLYNPGENDKFWRWLLLDRIVSRRLVRNVPTYESVVEWFFTHRNLPFLSRAEAVELLDELLGKGRKRSLGSSSDDDDE